MPDVNVSQAMTQLVPLAADSFDKNKVTPGVLGFLVFAALAVGVWMLMKSMNRHMGRVDFTEAPDPAAVDADKSAHADAGAQSPSAAPRGGSKG
ncbi:hypothetical protein ABCR94_24090 [Streptomyces sp. 21So2-11]|uniref:hypothetical protein n=1 Tax=Streptomyces sp. 21So2-11 TaxID=3144408 RepID=UPI0032198C9E